MVAASSHVADFCVPSTHPSLPGHFPGRPIVPGVVVLEGVLEAAHNWLGTSVRLTSLSQAKFLTPLLPEQHVMIRLTLQESELRFVVLRDTHMLAQGVMQVVVGAET